MQKAVELQKAGKIPEARKIIEDLIAKYPPAYRLNAFVATTYESEKNFDKAIEHMKIVVEKEPADIDMKMYLAELYTQKGDKDEAQKMLDIDRHDAGQGSDALHQLGHRLDQRRQGRRRDRHARHALQAVPAPRRTSSTIAPGPTSWARRWSRPRRISRSSCRPRHLMRASCRMPKSFSNSSKTSSKFVADRRVPLSPSRSARAAARAAPAEPHPPPPGGGTGPQEVCTATAAEVDGRDIRPSATAPARATWPSARRNASTATRAGGCSTRCGSTRPAPTASAAPTRDRRT